FNYKTVLHMITLVLTNVYKRIPASIWKGDGYKEGKIVGKMGSGYDNDFFLDTKEFPDKLRESFEDVVRKIRNLNNEYLNRTLLARSSGEDPKLDIVKDGGSVEEDGIFAEDITIDPIFYYEEETVEHDLDLDLEDSLVSQRAKGLEMYFYEVTEDLKSAWEKMYFSVAMDYFFSTDESDESSENGKGADGEKKGC
ncbi:MAG: hypothetical protein V5A88_08805, partial [Candidatus Thermoplasmatota archaeon]